MRSLLLLAAAVAFDAGFAAPPAVGADAPVPGHVIVARASGDALLIWDATPEVASIVSRNVSDADANAQLERDGLRVMSQSLGKVARDAKTVTVRIIYGHTGEVSKVYGSATFAGVERYAIVTMSGHDATSDRDKWKEAGSGSASPSWVEYKITGKLPPRG